HLSPGGVAVNDSQLQPEKTALTEAMEQALEIFAATGAEFGGGLSNHGPMGAEALVALGRAEAVKGWSEEYKGRLGPHEGPGRPVAKEEWPRALGDFGRVADWMALFHRELQEAAWQEVLKQWTQRLSPGLSAAAMHGLLRTAHAARSLARKETPARRRELAEGLAYWAARYQILPTRSDRRAGRLIPSEAVKQVEFLPVERRLRGSIVVGLRGLDGFEPFTRVADLVDPKIDAARFLSDLTETFANSYLANVRHGSAIAHVHAVTGASAVRLLLPFVSPEAQSDLLRYSWQATAAIFAAFGRTSEFGPFEFKEWKREDLIDRAVANGDAHAIKFTEACLREYAANPKPVYLAAAFDIVNRLS
ncbi:MAG TPA: hypothetical protein VJ302_07960, partial [Blastocatellia bacterium]|nr:hypothetical protein [Blastocatellia bacterium]